MDTATEQVVQGDGDSAVPADTDQDTSGEDGDFSGAFRLLNGISPEFIAAVEADLEALATDLGVDIRCEKPTDSDLVSFGTSLTMTNHILLRHILATITQKA